MTTGDVEVVPIEVVPVDVVPVEHFLARSHDSARDVTSGGWQGFTASIACLKDRLQAWPGANLAIACVVGVVLFPILALGMIAYLCCWLTMWRTPTVERGHTIAVRSARSALMGRQKN